MTDFDKALKALPPTAGYDPFAHKTVEDLCWICLHELDLVAEEEYWLPLAERKKCSSLLSDLARPAKKTTQMRQEKYTPSRSMLAKKTATQTITNLAKSPIFKT